MVGEFWVSGDLRFECYLTTARSKAVARSLRDSAVT